MKEEIVGGKECDAPTHQITDSKLSHFARRGYVCAWRRVKYRAKCTMYAHHLQHLELKNVRLSKLK